MYSNDQFSVFLNQTCDNKGQLVLLKPIFLWASGRMIGSRMMRHRDIDFLKNQFNKKFHNKNY